MDIRIFGRGASLFAVSGAVMCVCVIGIGQAAAGDWLITPEEAAMAPAPLLKGVPIEVGREDISAGPVIDVVEPLNGGRGPMPVQVLVKFAPLFGPVDLDSLKVVLVKFIQIDITDRIRPFVTAEGISVKEAKIPPGKHRVRISLADQTGAVSIREIAFEVL